MKIVHVEWMDVSTTTEWITDHKDSDVVPIASVGYLWYEDDKVIKIVQSFGSNGRYCDVTTIPKSVITKITKLHKHKSGYNLL